MRKNVAELNKCGPKILGFLYMTLSSLIFSKVACTLVSRLLLGSSTFDLVSLRPLSTILVACLVGSGSSNVLEKYRIVTVMSNRKKKDFTSYYALDRLTFSRDCNGSLIKERLLSLASLMFSLRALVHVHLFPPPLP